MDFNKSLAFIENKGSSLEKARIKCIIYGEMPQEDVIQAFFDLQNSDGGFPYGMQKGNLSTINETTVSLWWMEELNLLSSPVSERAYTYLLATQNADGSWDEDPGIAQYDLPPWIELGDLKTRLYLSAYAAYWLAVGGYQHIPAFRKALHFLLRNQDDRGKFFGYLHTNWIAAGVFLQAGKRYSKIASLAIQAVSARPLHDWDDSQIAWAMDCLRTGGLPRDHPFVATCLAELDKRQNSDGSWASEDGIDYAVGATIQTLKVFKRYSLLPGGQDD